MHLSITNPNNGDGTIFFPFINCISFLHILYGKNIQINISVHIHQNANHRNKSNPWSSILLSKFRPYSETEMSPWIRFVEFTLHQLKVCVFPAEVAVEIHLILSPTLGWALHSEGTAEAEILAWNNSLIQIWISCDIKDSLFLPDLQVQLHYFLPELLWMSQYIKGIHT